LTERALDAQVRIWSSGDYPVIARRLAPISVELIDAIGIGPGDRVLDIGVGNGNAAIEAAHRGARVTGIDLTPIQIERARARCVDEQVEVDLRVGNAEHLDVPDASFDQVLSVMGVIFAPDHERALAEMARAARPGGTVALTAWAEDGWSSCWRSRAAELLPAPLAGSPQPDAWGDPDELDRRLRAAGLAATVEMRSFTWEFASEAEALDTFVTSAGPYVQFLRTATELGVADQALAILRESLADANAATDGACRLPAPYLLGLGRTAVR
jgi:SAM-dependent methyltransferase